MSEEVARVGVIGVGHWGRNLVRNYAQLQALAGFAEADPERQAWTRQNYPRATCYESVDALLGDEDLDAVAIATPAASHGALVSRALDTNKHVFVEKPFCLDVAEGRQLADRAVAQGRVLMVGHLLLYHPAFCALQSTVTNGHLGRLRYIYSNRLSLGKIRREENALWSFAPHDISMILALTGRMPTRVVANGGAYLSPSVADTTLSHLTFPDDVQAHIFVSWLHPYKDHRLIVVGTDAMAVFDDVLSGADKLRLYRHDVGWNGNLPTVDRAAAEPIDYDAGEPLRAECAHFLDCVGSGATPRSDANEGLRVLAVLTACQRALAQNMPVALGPEVT